MITNTCFVPSKGWERLQFFSGIIRLSITRELRRLFISLGHVTFMTRARYYGGPQDHWIWMFWWSDIISGGLGPPDHRQSWTLSMGNLEHKELIYLRHNCFWTKNRTLGSDEYEAFGISQMNWECHLKIWNMVCPSGNLEILPYRNIIT